MDFEEDVLGLQNSSETGQNFNKAVQDKFSKIVIGEDLRRAIVALRSVPKVNWSLDSNCEDNRNGHASTEYIWKATDLSGSCSFPGNWQAAMKHNDCNRRTLFANNATQKMVADQTESQSEVMRKDSFTVASKRFDRTSDNKRRLVEETATSVQMSLFSREERGNATGIGEKSSSSNPSELVVFPTSVEVTRKPPPLPPKPSYLQGSRNKQLIMRKRFSHGKRTSGGTEDSIKSDISLNGTNPDVIDIYERSLDVLEKDESDQELEDLTSPRSDSPECFLEELLDSVPAEEFDTSECQKYPSIINSSNRETAKTHILSLDNLENRSNIAATLDLKEAKKKYKKGSETKSVLTSSAETESSAVRPEQNNNLSLKLVNANAESATRQLDVTSIKRNRTPQTEWSSSSSLAAEQTNESAVSRASDRELTPEDIFEEIMDSLETHQEDHGQTGVQSLTSSDNYQDQKHLHPGLSGRSSCDYLLENEWLSMYCDQLQAEAQHETITEIRIKEGTNTSNSESSKSSTGEAVSTSKQIPDALQSSNAALLSQDGKANITSQDPLQATVKRKPVPPLRETVQTFAKKDFLIYDIKLAPAKKPQPLAPRKDATFANDLPVNNCLNSFAGLEHEPIAAADETFENRRPIDTSSAESGAVSRDGSNMKNISVDERTSTTGSLLNSNDNGSLSNDRIVAILTRESELPGCDKYEEEMDLDLETELNRNLDACTASDVECQSIDNLVTSESLFPSDVKAITRSKKSSRLQVKVPGKLGEVLANKKSKKTQKTSSIEKTAEVVWPQRSEPENSNQVNIQENTSISTFDQSINTAQAACGNPCVKESPEFSDDNTRDLNSFETSRKIYLGYSKDPKLLNYEASLQESSIDAGNPKTVVDDSFDSDNEENFSRTIIRNVRSVEKESTARLEKQQELQVMSEEVTSQEIVLKIAWPKRELKSQSKITQTGKPPFRELQLKRVIRITDLDTPLNVLPNVATSQPLLAVTQQPSNVQRPGLASVSISTLQTNTGRDFIPTDIKSPVQQTVVIRNSSETTGEYESQANRRQLEHVSDSTVDVQQRDTVKVLRVPVAAVHKVLDIKDAVAAVGSTILDDFKRQPKKRNIRVTCEAIESKSRASLQDQDVTVIRNTIVDTYGPKSELVLSPGPTHSVQI